MRAATAAQADTQSEEPALDDAGSRIKLHASHSIPQLDCSSSLACLPDGNICVANTGRHALLKVSPSTGGVLGTYTCGESSGAKLRGPRGIVAHNGSLFVSDCYNSCVRRLSLPHFALTGTIGAYGAGDGQLRYPHGLAMDAEGTLFVADSGNARISAFDAEHLTFKFAFELEHTRMRKTASTHARGSSAGAANRMCARPAGLCVLDGELFATDANNRRLQVFSLAGQFRRFLSPTFEDGACRGQTMLVFPEGVAAARGLILVSDKRSDVVCVLAPHDGHLLQAIPLLMHRPHGLAGICSDGKRIFVVGERRSEVHVLTALRTDFANLPTGVRTINEAPAARATPSTTPRATPRATTRATPLLQSQAIPQQVLGLAAQQQGSMLLTRPSPSAAPQHSPSAAPQCSPVTTPRHLPSLPHPLASLAGNSRSIHPEFYKGTCESCPQACAPDSSMPATGQTPCRPTYPHSTSSAPSSQQWTPRGSTPITPRRVQGRPLRAPALSFSRVRKLEVVV